MEKKRVVHYINNFFAGIGGEEKADVPPESRKGTVGPGMALAGALGSGFEIVGTVICGDSYFGENLKKAQETLLSMIKEYQPDAFVAGPAFNAGRYGVACGTIALAVEKKLGIPVVTGMYDENPGVDMFKKDLHIIRTGNSAADMRNAMPKIVALLKKKIAGEEILSPKEEGYIERGIRVNYFADRNGAARGVEMLVKKMAGKPFETEYPMPAFDRVAPNPAVKDVREARIAVVTSGGIVPQGNPEHIESSSATKYGIYSIKGMDCLSENDFMTIHGGYDRAFVTKNPNLVVPLDALRELERAGEIGELVNYFVTTTGTGTSTGNAKAFGESFSKKLVADGVTAVILTST